MLVYVAGPYRGNVDRNIQQAREIAIELWEMGHVALCPHLNTAHFEVDCHVNDTAYLEGDLNMLGRCDAIVMTPDWAESLGAVGEYQYAQVWKIPIYIYPELPPLHPTEINMPQQAEHFRNIVMEMYRVHLDKNRDYSPMNILGAGEIGLATRIWDKVCRLMNLTGFKMKLLDSRFDKPSNPKYESLADTYMDLAVYGVIGMVYRDGAWGS